MSYYLKKHWKLTLLTITLAAELNFVNANVSLLMMRMFDALLVSDFSGFLFWCAVEIGAWALYFVLEVLRRWSYGLTVRKLNNSVRRDMAASLVHKNYREIGRAHV